jgi:TRAP-type C4-dicarboxylate transport system permease large subunit
MLVLASVTSLSIGSLFVAGLLPAAVIALCLMLLIYVRSRGRAGELKKHSMREITRAGFDAIPAIVAPVILIGASSAASQRRPRCRPPRLSTRWCCRWFSTAP